MKTITVDYCLAFRFHDLAKIGHMVTMVRVISSQISD
jgi:hypothetical protein